MRVLAVLAAVALPVVLAVKGTFSYDKTYDKRTLSTLRLACSDGSRGLYTKGIKTIEKLKTYPFVGGAPSISGWNSPNCGSCYKMTYNGQIFTYTAIDKSEKFFNMPFNAMNRLTHGQAAQKGVVNVTYAEVSPAQCGL